MFETIAIVGATGAVGRIIRQLLEEREFPYRNIRFLASKRSAGTTITFKGEEHVSDIHPVATALRHGMACPAQKLYYPLGDDRLDGG